MALSLGLYSQAGMGFSSRDRRCQWKEVFFPFLFVCVKGITLSSCVHTQGLRVFEALAEKQVVPRPCFHEEWEKCPGVLGAGFHGPGTWHLVGPLGETHCPEC